MNRAICAAAIAFLAAGANSTLAWDLGIAAPENFEVTLFAGDQLAHDITSMTIDAQGRVVVSGPGYIKTLHDEDGDGQADAATTFAERPASGARGMLFLGSDLIFTGDNQLSRLRDENGDGVADGKPFPLANVNTPEHGANGLVHGPDGWIYMICGNEAGIGPPLARTNSSPVRKPQAGAVVRFSPDFKQSEIFAHGFRNPYDLAFNANGQLFTVDSDGERDHYLPWYAPTRLFDIQQGAHHGWVQGGWTRSWNRPQSFFDNVERLVEIGRGSPTGVECYRHTRFGAHYHDGIFSCCWTLGRVYYFPLTPRDGAYASGTEIFLQTKGDIGFAPVDLAVGPEGDLFVAVGGRGTRGSVFRVRYAAGEREGNPAPTSDLQKVLAAPQPLSAWSRARWMPAAEKLGRGPFELAAENEHLPLDQRIRAIEVLTEMYGGLHRDTAWRLLRLPAESSPLGRTPTDKEIANRAQLVARAVWAAGKSDLNEEDRRRVFTTAGRVAPAVRRAVWEATAQLPLPNLAATNDGLELAYLPRRVHLARLFSRAADEPVPPPEGKVTPLAQLVMAQRRLLHGAPRSDEFSTMLALLERLLDNKSQPAAFAGEPDGDNILPRARLDAVRVLQLCLGDVRAAPTRPDVYAGYTANHPEQVDDADRAAAVEILAAAFPSEDEELNREIGRLLAMLEVASPHWPQLAAKLASQPSLKTSVEDDIHYLIILSKIPGERDGETRQKTAAALAFLHYKMLVAEQYPSRNWPLRVGEAFTELCRRDPQLAEALAQHRDFGMPAHSMFAELMPVRERKIAAGRLLARSKSYSEEEPWTPALVRLVAELDDPAALDAVRAQWHDFGLRDSIVTALAKSPREADRGLFVEALSLADGATVTRAANALSQFDATGTADEVLAAVAALEAQYSVAENIDTRAALVRLLATLADKSFEIKETAETPLKEVYAPVLAWFQAGYPEQARRLAQWEADSVVDWPGRLEQIEWAAGDADRGTAVYQRRQCAKCHGANARIGPDLAGVTGRWSRDDLLEQIVNPGRQVAPPYQVTRFVTRDGKMYVGIPIYVSPDGTLVQTGPDETIRIAGTEIVSTAKTTQSLMPSGLLRDASDAEIADLFAYLRTLAPSRTR